jgi:hypothetical protein
MRPASRLNHTPQQQIDELDVVGQDHAFVRASGQLTVAVERCVAVLIALTIGALAALDRLALGVPLVIASATVLTGLLVNLGASLARRHQRALELIADGRGELPLRAIIRARKRLLDPTEVERLARSLDLLRAEVEPSSVRRRPMRPVYSVRVIRALAFELGEVARLVRTGGALRGLARTEQLITDGTSPLYGNDEEALRQELGRIRFLLAS